MTNLDSILKSRDITLPTKVHLVKAMVFPVVVYGCRELEHKEGLADKAMEDPCKPGNPREVTKEDFIELYKKAM